MKLIEINNEIINLSQICRIKKESYTEVNNKLFGLEYTKYHTILIDFGNGYDVIMKSENPKEIKIKFSKILKSMAEEESGFKNNNIR
ncbi:MAG: hypothetical protein ACOC1K_01725 [Nanoarchaeota archaeon]